MYRKTCQNKVIAQPSPSGFEIVGVVCSSLNPKQRRTAWDAKDVIIGRHNCKNYWDRGLTIQESSELKELPCESTRRWIRVSQKARQDGASESDAPESVVVKPLPADMRAGNGIWLLVDGIEIVEAKVFDGTTAIRNVESAQDAVMYGIGGSGSTTVPL